ncbi:hybrid sensor histidine kinase/response regulator, partial [Acidovorax cattleyae]|nr:hybrid sensor histidine kinase/response regulator [Paracidovorax cattleyae]
MPCGCAGAANAPSWPGMLPPDGINCGNYCMAQHTDSPIPPSGEEEDAGAQEAKDSGWPRQGLPGWAERAWPSASLRTYLVAMILAATLPIALLLTYKVAADLVQARSRLQSVLGHSAAGLAQTVALDMASTVDALLAL